MRRVLQSEEDTQAGNYRPIRVDTPWPRGSFRQMCGCPLYAADGPALSAFDECKCPDLKSCSRAAGVARLSAMSPDMGIGPSISAAEIASQGDALILRSEDATASPQSPALAIINRRSRVFPPSAGRGCNEANLLVSAHRYFLCPSSSNRSSLARRSGPEGRSCRKARRRRQQPRKAISSSSILHSTN
jgi:hypothetical protein